MSLAFDFKNLFLLLLAFTLIACNEEDDRGLTLNDLQAEAIAKENRFKLSALVNVIEFNSNATDLEEDGDYYLLSALSGNQALYLRFPELAKGSYLGSDDPEIVLIYVDQDGRNFLSDNAAFLSDVSIKITAVDSVNRVFYANFSGTLYDIEATNVGNRDNQVNISGGKINKVSF